MDKNVNVNLNPPFGLASAVFLLFLALKLLGKIDWSWWWVTAPLWISAAIGLVLLAVFLVVVWRLDR